MQDQRSDEGGLKGHTDMKGLVYKGVNDLRLETIAEPTIREPTDAIIRVTMSAICGSDILIKHGLVPQAVPGVIVGHECCGVVESVGDWVSDFKRGDRVITTPAFYCGRCYYCRNQQPQMCERGGILGTPEVPGVQAEFARIPYADTTLARVPDELADEEVVFVGDILCTAFDGVARAQISAGDVVAIFGAGPIGLCATVSALVLGASKVLTVDLEEARLEAARAFGAHPIDARETDPVSRIKELTEGRGADVVIEAAGTEQTLLQCMQAKRRGGKVSVIGIFDRPITLPMNQLCFDSFSMAIGLGNPRYKHDLIRLIQAGRIDLRPLITHRFPLQDALAAYDIFENKLDGCIKAVLIP